MKKTSEHFNRAIISSSSISIDCPFCGRVHYASFNNEGNFEEGELEDLRKKAKKEPKKYIEHDYSSIEWGYLDGKQYVVDCECNGARRYEDFIWNHRYLILNYLDRRNCEIKEKADDLDIKIKDSIRKNG